MSNETISKKPKQPSFGNELHCIACVGHFFLPQFIIMIIRAAAYTHTHTHTHTHRDGAQVLASDSVGARHNKQQGDAQA